MSERLKLWSVRLAAGCLLVVLAWGGGSLAAVWWLTGRSGGAEPYTAINSFEHFVTIASDGVPIALSYAAPSARSPIVVLLHGNGGNGQSRLADGVRLLAEGYACLLVTHRAHGTSGGDVNDFGWSAQHDVMAAVRWVETHHADQPVFLWGQSLGAAAALFAMPKLGGRVSGTILECPYRDLATAVQRRVDRVLPSPLNALAFQSLILFGRWRIPYWEQISPRKAAANYPLNSPVLVLAGGADERAFPEEAEEICEAIGPGAQLVMVPRAGHLRLKKTDAQLYWQAVLEFLQRNTRES